MAPLSICSRSVLLLSLLAGCSPGKTEGERPRPPTWHGEVRAISERACVQCHGPSPDGRGQVAPFALDDSPEGLAAVAQWGEAMVSAVEDRRMPPWGMDASCREVPGSLWLTDAEVATFGAWRDAGFPMGDPADFVPPAAEPEEEWPAPDLVLLPPEPYTPSTAGPDDYRCLPIAEPTDRELWLRGTRTTPENLAVAHHVILFAIPPHALDELEAKDAAEPGPGYTCFGDSGLADASTVGGWAPGRKGTFLAEGTGQRIPAGSRFVVQMHYNTASVDGPPGSDRTPVELWTYPEGTVPEKAMIVYPIVKLGLEVPAGEAASVQTATQRIPVEGVLVGTTPHLHKHGRALETTLTRPDGEEQCLSRVPNWQFGWQNTYGTPPGGAIPISVEDEVTISCTYDNTGNPDPLYWGEGTADEMCLDYVGLVVDWDGGTTGGVCSGYPVCEDRCAEDDAACHLSCLTQSGDGCLFCGLDAATSDCVGFQCPVQGLPLSVCMDRCGAGGRDDFENVVRCLVDDCRAEFDAYWGCAGDVIASGTCAEEFAGCPELQTPELEAAR